ncbi:uncharacterized protein LOC128553340 [Mercenaria mercenaria]|uniref:uncharacterized protein LOC128553340 n=1 Tax=Mercenaria mercenaria TaxID=6596 RepID=UPI00234EA076|nr:uncharacterized protein LOC128553340 [Mercenaria mercenaria]
MGNYLSRGKDVSKDKEDISCSKRSEGEDSGFGDFGSLRPSLTGLKTGDSITIKKHFRYLKNELADLRSLVDKFVEDGDLDPDDSDEIFNSKTRRQSVDVFLRKILRFQPEAFSRFLAYLNESKQKHIADTLQLKNKYPKDLPDFGKTETQMTASIVMNLKVLCDELEPDKVADFFVVYLVFTIDDYESIISQRYRKLQAEEMVGHILNHIPKSYPVLMQLFREANNFLMVETLDKVVVQENQEEVNAKAIATFLQYKNNFQYRYGWPSGHFNMKFTLAIISPSTTTDEHDRVRQINEAIERINEENLKSIGFKIVGVQVGSIVIHLLNCGPLFQSRSRTEDDISRLLALIFLHPAVATFGSYHGLRFHVSVKSRFQELPKNFDEITTGAVEQNMDYLIEELSAVPFLSHKNAKKIFRKTEVDSVLNCEPISRENRMRKLLCLILNKGKPALRFFKKVLKEERMSNILARLSPGKLQPLCTCSIVNCEALLDEMSPSLVLDECKAMGIYHTVSSQLNRSQSRRSKSQIILQNAIQQEPITRQKILHILEKNYPDLYSALFMINFTFKGALHSSNAATQGA